MSISWESVRAVDLPGEAVAFVARLLGDRLLQLFREGGVQPAQRREIRARRLDLAHLQVEDPAVDVRLRELRIDLERAPVLAHRTVEVRAALHAQREREVVVRLGELLLE